MKKFMVEQEKIVNKTTRTLSKYTPTCFCPFFERKLTTYLYLCDRKKFVTMEKKTSIIVSISIVVFFGLCATIFFMWKKYKSVETEMQEIVEQMTYEKEQLEEEYSDLSIFEGQNYKIQNDSILKLLDAEKQRTQSLLHELKMTKATNARRIAELKKELASVRKVMVYYVNQIDSLNSINKTLRRENKDIKNKYAEVSLQAENLTIEKEVLIKQVELASMLEAKNIIVTTLNEHERKTSRLKRIALIKIDFTLSKNITTQTGIKNIFVRITAPDGSVLTKNKQNTFEFEGQKIAYSAKKQIEYMGEEFSETIYWTVAEVLTAGDYSIDIFVDGNLIGSKSFHLE